MSDMAQYKAQLARQFQASLDCFTFLNYAQQSFVLS